MIRSARRSHVEGTISSVGYRSGQRFVSGRWPSSPIGPMADLMWVTPDNVRSLLAPNDAAAEFVTSIYRFDEVRVGALSVEGDDATTTVRGFGVSVVLIGGRRRRLPAPRPLALTRFVEAPVARAFMGVATYGVSPTGVREWYQASGWRWVVGGSGSVDGHDLGPPGSPRPPLQVGFSGPPKRPSSSWIIEERPRRRRKRELR